MAAVPLRSYLTLLILFRWLTFLLTELSLICISTNPDTQIGIRDSFQNSRESRKKELLSNILSQVGNDFPSWRKFLRCRGNFLRWFEVLTSDFLRTSSLNCSACITPISLAATFFMQITSLLYGGINLINCKLMWHSTFRVLCKSSILKYCV